MLQMKIRLLQALILLLITACAPRIMINTDRDPKADFTALSSYAMAPMEEPFNPAFPMFDNEMNRKRIEEAIHREMQLKGFREELNTPDVLVDYHIVIKDKTAVDAYHQEGKGFWSPKEYEVHYYTEGTLVIHLVKQGEGQLIWQGTAASLIRKESSKAQERINKAITMIFEAYPSP